MKVGHCPAKILELIGVQYLECFDIAIRFSRYQHAQHILEQLNKNINDMLICEQNLDQSLKWWYSKSKLQRAILFWKQKVLLCLCFFKILLVLSKHEQSSFVLVL